MKKYLSYVLIAFIGILVFPGTAISQFFNASAYYGSTPTSIVVVLRPDFAFNGQLDEVGFTIQVPKIVDGTPIAMPTISVLNNFLATTFDSWAQESESVSDANFYNYKFGKVALTTAPTLNVASGTELQVVELQISGPAAAIPLIRLAHLASGGPGTQYGVYFRDKAGVDRTDYVQMFYGVGLFPLTPAASENAGYETYQYVLPSANPLPVKFLGFSVRKNENNALLNWQIENESSITDRYEIERSTNSADFQKISTVLPKKNGSSTNSYELTDMNLSTVRSFDVVYYRVKQVDRDGQFIHSAVKSLRLNSKEISVGVFPNPVRGFATLTIDLEQDSDAVITINDASGRQVRTIPMQLFKGPNIKKVNMETLAGGNYMLKVQTSKEIKTVPVVKAN